MTEGIIIAILSLVGTLCGSYFAQRKTTALISYRLQELEKKVYKHNNWIERTYKLEEKCSLQDEQIKVVNHRIEDLERAR
jgi:hypothetical protein